jgi:Undecaprenyl-phosphate glucose phosphotransferase
MRPAELVPVRSRVGERGVGRAFRLLDLVLLFSLALLSAKAASDGLVLDAELALVGPFALAAFIAAWALKGFGAYSYNLTEGVPGHLCKVAAAFLVATIAGLLALSLSGTWRAAPSIMLWTTAAGLLVSALHIAAWDLTRVWRRSGRMTPNVVFVGATPNARELIQSALSTREVAVLGVFDDRLERAPATIEGVPVLGDTEALLNHRILPCVDRVVITVTTSAQNRVRELIERLRSLPNEVTLFVDVEGAERRANTLSRVMASAGSFCARDDGERAFNKRVQDIVVASFGLVFGAPLLLGVALAVKLDSPGPLLFRQRRHGFNNEVITVYKFRSMRADATDYDARQQVTADDERVTRVGRFIRNTSLDELPQLFNVLRGEMSIVGPRPHSVGMLTGRAETHRLVAEYAHRHRLKPGVTGWAQINGSRGPLHTAEEVRQRVAYDIDYIERQSLWLDLYIILMTLPRLLGDKGVR